MKKFICLLIIVLTGYLVYYFNIDKKENSELSNLGFKQEEISEIETSFSDKNILKLVSLEDKDLIYELINNEEFDSDKLDNYVNFYNDNKNISIENIIKLVNNDIDTIDNFVYDEIIVELIDEEYYIFDNTIRYMNYYNENDNLSAGEIITNVNSNIDYDFYTNTASVDLEKGNLILVNKYYYLSEDYEPEDLVYIESPYSNRGGYIKEEVYEAFKDMVDAAYEDDIVLYSVSPYRSYSTQDGLYEWYASYDGYENADTYSARPGFSEHQTGLAIDINSTDDSFAYTDEAEWLASNAHKYGFILRYPKGKEYITGYQYEPWHFRYVGLDVATKIYKEDITFEEYYAFYVGE